MIIAFLIAIIGIIPFVLALSVLKLFKGSELAFPLLIYMLSISVWQLDIGVLYLKDILSEEHILWLFKIFRAGTTFCIPIVFYLSFITFKRNSTIIKNERINRCYQLLFNRTVFFFLVGWSIFIYLINMTKLGITGLDEIQFANSPTHFYFPTYGPLEFLFLFHMGAFFIFNTFSYFFSKNIQNTYLKEFLRTFSLCSFLLFIFGILNFIPGSGSLFSSLGVIIFSVIVIFSFVKMNVMMTVNYNRLMERQKKLDYTGNLTASLVHEVKNNLQVIRGFSKLLNEVPLLPVEGKRTNQMIDSSAQQLGQLTENYANYIKTKSMEFKITDLNEVVDQAIDLCKEMLNTYHVEIFFEKKYKHLKANVNQVYLKQVFVNLLKNSMEAITPECFIRKITILADIKADFLVINFFDSGKGIPVENLESVFDPFISSKTDGLGLGLPFIKKVIFEHHGDIKIISSSPTGTHFRITLPQYAFTDL